MPESDKSEFPLPESNTILLDTSVDGRLTLLVVRDDEPETPLMREFGGMGTVRVYDSKSGELYHEERTVLSPSAVFGPGPTADEVEHWSNIISMFTD